VSSVGISTRANASQTRRTCITIRASKGEKKERECTQKDPHDETPRLDRLYYIRERIAEHKVSQKEMGETKKMQLQICSNERVRARNRKEEREREGESGGGRTHGHTERYRCQLDDDIPL
jgi:hypothetical protein